MGVPVVKHGNRAITKSSGSADVLELLGIRLNLASQKPVEEALEKVGAAFLYAPSYHPAFAVVAPIRKQLGAQGQRTIFNLLGPLLNPARPAARLVGVFKKEQVLLYSRALQLMGCGAHRVVCGLMPNHDGELGAIGEVSAHGPTYWKFVSEGGARAGTWQFHRPIGQLSDLLVKDAEHSARIINEILGGECRGLPRARHAIDSGAALDVLSKWRAYSA
jgi:anthranilate phosphoribosyltransferase